MKIYDNTNKIQKVDYNKWSADIPAAQVVQSVAPAAENLPAGHGAWPVAAEAELAMYPADAAVH